MTVTCTRHLNQFKPCRRPRFTHSRYTYHNMMDHTIKRHTGYEREISCTSNRQSGTFTFVHIPYIHPTHIYTHHVYIYTTHIFTKTMTVEYIFSPPIIVVKLSLSDVKLHNSMYTIYTIYTNSSHQIFTKSSPILQQFFTNPPDSFVMY